MSENLSAERLAEIHQRAQHASRGPWRAVDVRHQRGGQIRLFTQDDYIANVLAGRPNVVADAEFIAHSRQDVENLLEEVERLRERAERAEQEVAALRQSIAHRASVRADEEIHASFLASETYKLSPAERYAAGLDAQGGGGHG